MKKTYDAVLEDGAFKLKQNKFLTFCAHAVAEVFSLPKDCKELTFELTDVKPRGDDYHSLHHFKTSWDDHDYKFHDLRGLSGWAPILADEVAFIRRRFPRADVIYISVYA